ncbi:MAG: aspartate kinase, partial [Bacteroidota bacterium]
MKVLKFGGSSVADAQRIRQVANIILNQQAQWPLVVVVSAFGGTTDQLDQAGARAAAGNTTYKDVLAQIEARSLGIVRDLIPVQAQSGVLAQVKLLLNELEDVLKGVYLVRERSPKTRDLVLSFGERISSLVIGECVRQGEIAGAYADSRELIRTNRDFGAALVDFEETNKRIQARFGDLKGVVIVPGFIASTVEGETSTLGRGGSDYSAAIYAAALKAEILEIWTDVNGVLTADPRRVPNAKTISEATFDEAMELSHFGAKVIYPPTIQPVRDLGIPIAILNTFDPEGPRTVIRAENTGSDLPVKGMTSMGGIALMSLSGAGLVGVPGSSSRLFGALAAKEINVILITQASSEHSITFAVPEADAAAAREVVDAAFVWEISTGKVNPLREESGLSIVAHAVFHIVSHQG